MQACAQVCLGMWIGVCRENVKAWGATSVCMPIRSNRRQYLSKRDQDGVLHLLPGGQMSVTVLTPKVPSLGRFLPALIPSQDLPS